MVRIHPDPPTKIEERIGGCSSVGRAPALQAGGRRFDPDQLHHLPKEWARGQEGGSAKKKERGQRQAGVRLTSGFLAG